MTWVFKRFRCSATPQLPPVVPHLLSTLPPEVLHLIAVMQRQNGQDHMEKLAASKVGTTFEYEHDDAVWNTVHSYRNRQFGIFWSVDSEKIEHLSETELLTSRYIERLSPEELQTRLLTDLNEEPDEEPDLMELVAMVAEKEKEEWILDWWLSLSLLCRKKPRHTQ
jgi:hypothetical protein